MARAREVPFKTTHGAKDVIIAFLIASRNTTAVVSAFF